MVRQQIGIHRHSMTLAGMQLQCTQLMRQDGAGLPLGVLQRAAVRQQVRTLNRIWAVVVATVTEQTVDIRQSQSPQTNAWILTLSWEAARQSFCGVPT